ncbi:hypothetical protein K469DRAFT_739224 [Zopfia rhizophila CBS 207.26]|uniref:Uncharacterized protein n=1 Tax=Zopfia rhizophila CBS 207.26 TaxID=1314779 RepID=A0A6A6E2Z0_9PEZI|nr:hypothetical protein K469DRAFT_739224 [Zopfia rhizophila CBS 207.26]
MDVPGFGLPLCYEIGNYDDNYFAHGANDWRQYPRLTVVELSMLALMNALTDKPNWNQKIFNEEIVAKWRNEALEIPFKLRDKARSFEKTGYVPALDTGSGCAKSDTIVTEQLRQDLIQAVQPLLDNPDCDWHPGSNNQVLNLVHPSLFPLVYGRTRVMRASQVGLEDFLNYYGRGEVTKKEPESTDLKFSTKFQWLPCEVEFVDEKSHDVEITSYINNLHPKRHKPVYRVIEKLISLAIPMWNEVLVYPFWNRTPPRIQTYGAEFEPPYPEWAGTWISRQGVGVERYQELLRKVADYIDQPDNPEYDATEEDEEEIDEKEKYENGTWVDEGWSINSAVDWKYKRLRHVKHPEPGVAYSYGDWKRGLVNKAIVEPTSLGGALGFGEHERYNVDLANSWRDAGLQIIVKLASIELTPEKPEYAGGNWHVEGMLNEHIAATAIYYYDVENTTESRIRFRQEADLDNMYIEYEQEDHEPLCEILGTESMRDEPAVQELGSISTPQGRLLAFPNTLQHCVKPFRLADPSRPGHRRFLVLWLVDPHYRIISTRNVPPQRHDWWAASGYDQVPVDQKLPAELAKIVHDEIGEWPMGMEEAKALRLELMAERTQKDTTIENNFEEYNFCEH